MRQIHTNYDKAFTLAELLIALAILGVIATFTIPKVLQAQKNSAYVAMSKEAFSMVSQAYRSYQLKNTVTASTGPKDLTQYMNYVKQDTVSIMDDLPNDGTNDCSDASITCLTLHNGGTLIYANDRQFNGTGTTNAIVWVFDPDSQASATPGVGILLYYNGQITTYDQALPGSSSYFGGSPITFGPNSTFAATWFSWN